MATQSKQLQAARRAKRVRARVASSGASHRASLSVTNTGIFAQIIDDAKGATLVSGRDKGLTGTKTERAKALGEALGKKASEAGITRVVLDRGSKKFHGRVKAFTEGLQAAGVTV